MTKPTYQEIYQAVTDLSDPDLHATVSYMDIERLIKAGAPLNPSNENERSLVEPWVAAFKKHDERVLPHMHLLLEAGANPMLEKACYSTIMVQNEEAADYLLCAMFNSEEKGKPMRSENGRNPLHVLMSEMWWVSSDNSREWMKDRYHGAWINERDKQGNTPLHALWVAVAGHMEFGAMSAAFVGRAWKETAVMLKLGANIEPLECSDNPSVASMILQAVSMGLDVPAKHRQVFEQAQVVMEARDLDVGTPFTERGARARRI